MSVRVLVVDDSPISCDVLADILGADPEIVVAGFAHDGIEAEKAAADLKPDVVVMDVAMPRLGGIEAVARIMGTAPRPILVVSGDEQRAAGVHFEALRRGALDVCVKPALDDDRARRAFVERVKVLATVPVVHHLAYGIDPARASHVANVAHAPHPAHVSIDRGATNEVLVAIGASTGGPAAVAAIVGALPTSLRCRVVVVQHIDASFTESFASWLRTSCGRPVRLASSHDVARPGEVVVAAPDAHLVVDATGSLRTRAGEIVDGHRPSATALFSSIASSSIASSSIGVLLTGMGRDGASGLLAMKNAGALTIVQDHNAVVDGMPRAARELGAASRVLPLTEIAPAIAFAVEARRV